MLARGNCTGLAVATRTRAPRDGSEQRVGHTRDSPKLAECHYIVGPGGRRGAGNPVVDGRTRAVLSTSVENRSPIICFAITSDGKRAASWRLRAGLKQPELFLEREGYGKKFHFSLHASGQWHMKEGRQERISWARPGEVVPGYTRAVGIVQPAATAVREDPPAEETVLIPRPRRR